MMINCLDCKLIKDSSEFYRRKHNKLSSYCKPCFMMRIYKHRASSKYKQKIYMKSDVGKFKQYKRSALKRNYEFLLTQEQFNSFKRVPCYYCGCKYSVIGIDRLDNKLGYTLDNSVSCCTMCNRMKMNHSEAKFLNKVEQIYFNRKAITAMRLMKVI